MKDISSGMPAVNRVYSIKANNGVGYHALMSLAYSRSEFLPLVEESSLILLTTKSATSVIENQTDIPENYALNQAYPSPFNPTTTIKYSLPEDSRIILCVYNVLGQVVATLADELQIAGFKSVSWTATDMASGIYFYKLDAVSVSNPSKSFYQIKKMILLK
jgi:hypothetical protein